MDHDFHAVSKSSEGFVDTVIYDLEHAVMQAAFVGVADIHVGPLAHALEALEFLNLGGVVCFGAGLVIC